MGEAKTRTEALQKAKDKECGFIRDWAPDIAVGSVIAGKSVDPREAVTYARILFGEIEAVCRKIQEETDQ